MRKIRKETSVILSVRPEYVFKMYSGTKAVEFRKRIWDLRSEIKRAYIYETAPISAISGYIEIAEIIKGTPDDVFRKAGVFTGIDYPNYKKYAGSATEMYGIVIKRFVRLQNAVSLYRLDKTMKAPQSFYYCSDEMSDKILNLSKTGTATDDFSELELIILNVLQMSGATDLERKDIH